MSTTTHEVPLGQDIEPCMIDRDVIDQATRLRALAAELTGEGSGGSSASQAVHERNGHSGRSPSRSSCRVVAIASGKGGVGKTTIAVNLAIALASRGLRTVLLDADLGTANADVLCGMMPVARLEHVLTPLPTHDGARRTLRQIAMEAPGGFRLIPGSAGIARIADLAAHEQRALLDSLIDVQAEADVLLIDCGAGISRSVLSFVAAADASIVVATPEPTSVADAYALIKAMLVDASAAEDDSRSAVPLLVVNQSLDDRDAVRVAARLSAVTERFLGVELRSIGSIAQDVRVAESVRAREPVLLRSPASHASRNIQSIAESLIQHLGLVRTNWTHCPPRSRGLMRALARVLRLSGA